MSNPTLDIIMNRRSHRKYKPEQLTQQQLQALIDAALQSPSAVNRQPWHFSVVQDPVLAKRISDASHKVAAGLPEGKRSPRFNDPAFHVFYHAPTVFMISSPKEGGSPLDCGIAAQSIVLAAESMGLGCVMVALSGLAFQGEEADALRRDLQFPEGYDQVIAVAVGHADDTKPAHDMDRSKVSILR